MRRTYLFFETLTELRAMWCMYTDPRYRMSWVGRLVPLGLALFILVSAFLVPGADWSSPAPLSTKSPMSYPRLFSSNC